jgi:NTP pyrophosphatase (non-canonical NTP hydrolase)
MINELAKKIHQNAIDKGFFDEEKNIGEMLMLIVTEVAEACEADRKNDYCKTNIQAVNGWVSDADFQPHFRERVKNTFEDELADIMIRVMDLAAHKGIDLEAHIKAKMRYNASREKMHGKKY